MSWFPRFPRIRSRQRPTPQLPFNSSLEQVAALASLREAPGWKHHQDLLERVAQAEYDRIAGGLPYEEYLAAVGAYQASRRAVDLVDTLIQKAAEHNGRKRDTAEHEREHSSSIFFASPYR